MFALGRKCFLWLFISTLLLALLIGSLGTLTVVLLKTRTNNLLTPWKEPSRGNLVRLLLPNFFFIFVWYSFQKTGFLNPSSNSFFSFTLSLLYKVTIRTYSSIVILNVVAAIFDITQSLLQFNSRWILQLINYSNILVEQLFLHF